MRVRDLIRDAVLVAAAVAVGWWYHGAGAPVHAQRGGDFDGRLAFQFAPENPASSLSIYSPADHMLYVYPRVAAGNSHIDCQYSFHISRPGAAIDRENCKPGNALP